MPKVSIIVPVYNVEQYLRQCLDSILVQTFTDWECILVDDGSTDCSKDICDEFANKDSRFRVVHKKNGGVSSARNKGIELSRGVYITFVDADDTIDKDVLSAVNKYFQFYDIIQIPRSSGSRYKEINHSIFIE